MTKQINKFKNKYTLNNTNHRDFFMLTGVKATEQMDLGTNCQCLSFRLFTIGDKKRVLAICGEVLCVVAVTPSIYVLLALAPPTYEVQPSNWRVASTKQMAVQVARVSVRFRVDTLSLVAPHGWGNQTTMLLIFVPKTVKYRER